MTSLEFRKLIAQYGNAEFMLGLEGMGKDREMWSRKVRELEDEIHKHIYYAGLPAKEHCQKAGCDDIIPIAPSEGE